MTCKPIGLDHVNIFVRNAERSRRWYTEILGLHTQDTSNHPPSGCARPFSGGGAKGRFPGPWDEAR